ncbi:hypothetical protein [Flavobacterium sp. GCM10027622]|uniref:hypothetical protein n=1 Tax=unclassified Flavobacterium TaxID=196869 RepID=UPI00361F2D65
MIFRIDTYNAGILTRDELTISEWNNKFDRFISLTSFTDDNELLKSLKFEFNLNEKQIDEVESLISTFTIKTFRFSCSKYEHFKIEPVYLDIKNNKGKLIYFKDWDYIFQQIENEYFLWCYLGGIADIQREIKLSVEQVEKYHKIGLAQIDYLIDNVKKLNDSTEYKKAIEENRRIL